MIRVLHLGSKVGVSLVWPEGGYNLKEHPRSLGGLACSTPNRLHAFLWCLLSWDEFRVKGQGAHKECSEQTRHLRVQETESKGLSSPKSHS